MLDILLGGIPYLLIFALGSAIGSFLNVVIYRLPAGLSLLHPPSRCPNCQSQLKPYDNVPVMGWLWLQGKCRFCQWPIPRRYPLVEAATGLVFVLIYSLLSFSWLSVGYWLLASWLIALAMIDLDTYTLPNKLTQSGLLMGIAVQTWLGFQQTPPWPAAAQALFSSIFAAVLGIWLFDMISLLASTFLGKTAMGGGDAKLAAMMGAWLGWKLLILASFLACLLGAVIGVGAIALKLRSRRQPIPFGPFLALGTIIAALWGDRLVQAYLDVVL